MDYEALPYPSLLDAVLCGHFDPDGTSTETPTQRMTRLAKERSDADLAAFIEDVEWMAETGESTDDVARRRGVTPQAINKRLAKAKRIDLWERLRANEVARFGETLGERRARENGERTSRWFGPTRMAS